MPGRLGAQHREPAEAELLSIGSGSARIPLLIRDFWAHNGLVDCLGKPFVAGRGVHGRYPFEADDILIPGEIIGSFPL